MQLTFGGREVDNKYIYIEWQLSVNKKTKQKMVEGCHLPGVVGGGEFF